MIWDIRWLTDPVGRRLMRWMQAEAIEEYARTFPNEEGTEEPSGYSEVAESFLELFERRTKKYILWTGEVLIVLFFIDSVLCGRLPDQSSGIAINFLGSVILARSAMKGPYTILATSAGFGSSTAVRKQEIGSAVDGPWGVFLILVGFAIQYVAIIGTPLSATWCPLF